MARKRMIDPDFWTDSKVQNIPWAAVGFQVGLISYADDEGRLEWSVSQLAARICGVRDDVSRTDVQEWMAAIEREKLVILYQSGGKTYAFHPNWKKHQYVNRPQKSKLPAPPITGPSTDAVGGSGTVTEDNIPDAFREYSRSSHGNISESHVPLESDSESVLEFSPSDKSSGAARACACENARLKAQDFTPEDLAPVFLAVFANRRTKQAQRPKMATWIAWLREMCSRYSWPQVWGAFAQAHTDGDHAPLHGSSAVWSNLRATEAKAVAPPARPGLRVVTREMLEAAE